ncbi:RICIN domain-containing protein [Cytophagaceae bacterium YF14B1]|uniref:RICIN domain-containing protein n=1 Tax=Xanthocytophaga flava TaxID=3048013 RepID=A0AAE3QI97_9BACT|nr:RICIN domain-containing protein [Xanthocytophaga flavus]MDJ1479136.1 RICIN domain-containing protein [Xanthocytophaga flavus]
MTKYYTLFFLLAFTVFSKVRAQNTSVPLAPFYQSYFKIADKQKGYIMDWNKKNQNVYGNTAYHGSDNQKWLLMPLSPASEYAGFLIVNKENGSLLDINQKDNFYAFNGYTNGGSSQLFVLNKVPQAEGYYYINNSKNSNKVLERSNSKAILSPFKRLSNHKNNYYFGKFTGGENQQFAYTAVESISFPFTSYRPLSGSTSPLPPLPANPTDMAGTGMCTECPAVFLGETLIPFPFVQNDLPRAQQVKYSPYYRLEYSRYWKQADKHMVEKGETSVRELVYNAGMADADMKAVAKMLNISFTSNSNLAEKKGNKQSSLIAHTIAQAFLKTEIAVTSHEENTYQPVTIKVTHKANEQTLLINYLLIDKYVLYRADGSKALEWEVTLSPGSYSATLAYVNSQKKVSATLRAITHNFTFGYVNSSGGREEEHPQIEIKQEGSTATTVSSLDSDRKAGFSVLNIYPNPFESAAQVDISLSEAAHIKAEVYNLSGQKVKEIIQTSDSGIASVQIEGAGLQEGLYIIRLEVVALSDSRKKLNYQQKVVLKR